MLGIHAPVGDTQWSMRHPDTQRQQRRALARPIVSRWSKAWLAGSDTGTCTGILGLYAGPETWPWLVPMPLRCAIQRIARRSRVLAESRIARLDELGFDWSGADPLS